MCGRYIRRSDKHCIAEAERDQHLARPALQFLLTAQCAEDLFREPLVALKIRSYVLTEG
jgi:hypothetical protein